MAEQSSSRGGGLPGQPAALNLVHQQLPQVGRQSVQVFGRLISAKSVRSSVIRTVLKVAWARFGDVKMLDVNENTLAFVFANERDRSQILDCSPWIVHGHCLNLRSCLPNSSLRDIDFKPMDVWIQVHGLSLAVCNVVNAHAIGDSVGRFLQAEDPQVAKGRTYLRIRVEINTMQPL